MKSIVTSVLMACILFCSSSYASECTLPESLEAGAVFKSFTVGSRTIKNAKILEVNATSCWMKVVRLSVNEEVWVNLRLLSTITP